jgi:hypothetical protein
VNKTTSDQCPMCREKGEVAHMKANRSFADVVVAFKRVREDLMAYLKSSGNSFSPGDAFTTSSRTTKRPRADEAQITKRVAHMSMYGQSKKYVREAIERLCLPSRVKPVLEGEHEDFERYYKELVHMINAQLGSAEPKSLDEVVGEVNRKEKARRVEAAKGAKSKAVVEKMKNGEVCNHQRGSLEGLITA